ncbi:MAG: MFS transporter, partial [Symploca sp. SIO2B6]|nr:MFS transporter [Symploca sp. SIO2B6]
MVDIGYPVSLLHPISPLHHGSVRMTIDQPYRCPSSREQHQPCLPSYPQTYSYSHPEHQACTETSNTSLTGQSQSVGHLPNQQNRRTLAILMVSILMDFIGFGVVMPLLPFYAQFFGASSWEVGILLGLFPLMSIVAPTLWGNLSDRIGRRPALLFNVVGTTLSYFLLSVAHSLTMLFISRLLAGATSASIVIGQSYASDLSTTENRTKVL